MARKKSKFTKDTLSWKQARKVPVKLEGGPWHGQTLWMPEYDKHTMPFSLGEWKGRYKKQNAPYLKPDILYWTPAS